MTKERKLLEQMSLAEFFRERVQAALSNHQLPASNFVEFYLVNLLEEFRKTEKLFERHGLNMVQKPLALILAQAVQGDVHTKIRCLKQLGDVSLYTAGFFGDSLKRKTIDVDYYIQMGGTAYSALSQLLSYQKTFSELYAELSISFRPLVDVLSEVATTKEHSTNQDLLKIYERWITTGDDHWETLLKKAGIVIPEKDGSKKQ